MRYHFLLNTFGKMLKIKKNLSSIVRVPIFFSMTLFAKLSYFFLFSIVSATLPPHFTTHSTTHLTKPKPVNSDCHITVDTFPPHPPAPPVSYKCCRDYKARFCCKKPTPKPKCFCCPPEDPPPRCDDQGKKLSVLTLYLCRAYLL